MIREELEVRPRLRGRCEAPAFVVVHFVQMHTFKPVSFARSKDCCEGRFSETAESQRQSVKKFKRAMK